VFHGFGQAKFADGGSILGSRQTTTAADTGERTGLAAGTSLYKKHILKNWFVYIILSKTT